MNLIKSILKPDEFYLNPNEIPDNIFYRDSFEKENDSVHFWNKVANTQELKSYLFDSFKENQPKTYQTIQQNHDLTFFYAIKRTARAEQFRISDVTVSGFTLNKQIYLIGYTPFYYEIWGESPQLSSKTIPIELLNSWFYRAREWNVAEKMIMDFRKSRLPTEHMITFEYLFQYIIKKNQKNVFDFLESKFQKVFLTTKMKENIQDYVELRCFLDTRNNEDFLSSTGFQVFANKSPNQKTPEFYVVKNADPFSIKRLHEPVKAVDEYAAHLFSGATGEFDFFRYAEDF